MNFKKTLPYIISILIFAVVSLAYFSPVLKGQEIVQSDIVQFIGSSKEIKDFRKNNDNKEPYWTNTSFGGMPSYVVSAYYPHNYIYQLDKLIRFLPRPADYLFLYLIGLFILLRTMKIDWRVSVLGALAFGFSTYLIIILGVGHNSKAHAIAYMPLVLSGLILLFRRKYLWGFVVASLAMALEINTSHIQMTYYLMFLLMFYFLVQFIYSIKNKEFLHFLKSTFLFTIAVVFSILLNSTRLLATKEYSEFSTRGKSELTINPDGTNKENKSSGLDKAYITQYSYGILESFNLAIPRFMGGASSEKLDSSSATYKLINKNAGSDQARKFSEATPTYWGDQPIVSAPAYIGIVVLLLFVMSLFLVKKQIKYWLVPTIVLVLLLSWGKNFPLLTDFMIDYFPLYNKFRAVSSIQVILELAIPILAALGLNEFIKKENNNEIKLKALKNAIIVTGGGLLFWLLLGSILLQFSGLIDPRLEKMLPRLSKAVIEDRHTMFFYDIIKGLVLVISATGLLYFFLKNKISKNTIIIALSVLIVGDLVFVDRNYVNNDNFSSNKEFKRIFTKTEVDREILKDKSHYRVANYTNSLMNNGTTSYHHKSIGGYHAAKPMRYQEIYDFHIAKNNVEVLNMLNTKYFMYQNQKGTNLMELNKIANGNSWFIDSVTIVNSADEEITSLSDFNSLEKAFVHKDFKNLLPNKIEAKDSLSSIFLTNYSANELYYKSESNKTEIAIFSEIYYKNGWNAYIDGKKNEIFRANYILRGLVIPKGKHDIVFKFEPEIIKTGTDITLVSYIVYGLFLLGFIFIDNRNKK
ncbi:MAG: YfhO family protein [Flavobacteriaceae bacterium]|nr:YfhO family protein [Flavobacteriaceae bacterium]